MIPRFLLAPTLLCLTATAPCAIAHAAPFAFLDDEAEPSGYDVSATVSAPAQLALSRQSNGDGYVLEITPTALQLDVTQSGKTRMLARVANAQPAPWSLTFKIVEAAKNFERVVPSPSRRGLG